LKAINKNIHASAIKNITGLRSMNEEAKGDIPPKARIIQELIYPSGHLNHSSQNYKNIIL